MRSLLRSMWVIFAGFLLSACPEISVDPISGPQGAEEMVIDVYGTFTNFNQGQTTASFTRSGGPSGIVVHQPIDVQGSGHLRLTISIPANEPIESQTLTITTGAEEAETSFDVTVQPSIRKIQPAQGEQGDVGLIVRVSGANTHFTQSTQWPEVDITGVTVVSWNVVDDEHAEVGLDIALDAPKGVARDAFRVFSDYQVLSADFKIKKARRSIFIAPNELEQGTTGTVSITGVKTAFLGGFEISIDPPDGIDVIVASPLTETMADVTLAVHSYAAAGRRTLRVTDPHGTLEADFHVTEDLTPPSVSFQPHVAYPGDVIAVEAVGVNTTFVWPDTGVTWDPPDANLALTVDSVTDPTHATLTATVPSGAVEREYSVTLSTGAEHAVGTFWVVPEPSMTIYPVDEHRDESVVVEVFGTYTHFDQTDTSLSFDPASGLSGSDWLVGSPSSATFTLHVAPDAPLGDFADAITVSTPRWNETLHASFHILEGYPVADLNPTGVEQGSQSFLVQAEGRYTSWSTTLGDTTVTLGAACQEFMTLHDVNINSQTELTFEVDVEILAPLRSCPIDIVTDYGVIHEQVTAQLQILSGATQIVGLLPRTISGYVDGAQLYSIDLVQGQVLRARASCNPVLYLDPTLAIYAPGGSYTSAALAENEDEHAATEDALIVYQAPESGTYYLVVQDRLGFEVGLFTLALDYFHLVDPSDPMDSGNNISRGTADPMTGPVIRGSIDLSQSPRWYEVQPSAKPAAARTAVQIIARSVSPFETSASDVLLQLYNSLTSLDSSNIGTESLDPVLYVDTASLTHIVVENDLNGLGSTTYWVNLRPWVVINEVYHDEVNDWEASFVELYGEPGVQMSSCNLVGMVSDGAQESEVFNISLDGSTILESGYYVVAHDDLVPGAGTPHINTDLKILNGPYASVGVFLECDNTTIDRLCWRGSHLTGCIEGAVPDATTIGNSLGRGYHVDTNDNLQDFLPQPEPSPWNRNLREVW